MPLNFTFMLADLKIWSPQKAKEPADDDMSSLFTPLTRSTGNLDHRGQEGFKAQKGMSPCPERTSRTWRTTTLWPEDHALFLHTKVSWKSTFSWESLTQTWTPEKSVKPPAEVESTKGGKGYQRRKTPCSGTLTLIKAALLACQVHDLRIPDSSLMINTLTQHLPPWLPISAQWTT